MGTEIREAQTALESALAEFARASTENDWAMAVMSLHAGLDAALRAHLVESYGFTLIAVDSRSVNFPQLVDLVRDHTSLFAGDRDLPGLLVSLSGTRNRIAHSPANRPPVEIMSKEASQYVKVLRGFWSSLFDERFPERLLAASRSPQTIRVPVPPIPTPAPRTAAPTPSWTTPAPTNTPSAPPGTAPAPVLARPLSPRWPAVRRTLKALWSDENAPRLQKRLLLRRVIGIILFLALAKLCKEAAVFTARWPEPIKYGGVVLFLLAMALFAGGLYQIWKVLCQIRLKGVLIFVVVTYVLLLSAVLLTSTSSVPLAQQAWLTTRDWAGLAGRAALNAAGSGPAAVEEFRVAYLGYRHPVRVPGVDTDDPALLTPIPANRPVRLAGGAEPGAAPGQAGSEGPAQAGAGSAVLPLPDCPHAQARLTAPRVGEAVQDQVAVLGTADIDGFDYYKFEYRQITEPEDAWHWIASFETPVDNGLLGTWNVSALPAGLYALRLVVVNIQGNYPFPPCQVTVQIAHP